MLVLHTLEIRACARRHREQVLEALQRAIDRGAIVVAREPGEQLVNAVGLLRCFPEPRRDGRVDIGLVLDAPERARDLSLDHRSFAKPTLEFTREAFEEPGHIAKRRRNPSRLGASREYAVRDLQRLEAAEALRLSPEPGKDLIDRREAVCSVLAALLVGRARVNDGHLRRASTRNGSEVAASGSVTTVAPVLLKSAQTTKSADGRTTTVSVDMDGNGTSDEVTTAVTRIDGSQVATKTANAAARALAPAAGEIVWSSAIAATNKTTAAASTSTTSADGNLTVVSADYDGNGTYEHTEIWRTKVDGSRVGEITDKSAVGTIVAKGTQTISADGRTTTLRLDSTNDGIVDHTETVVVRGDGSKTKTVIDTDVAGTVIRTVTTSVSADGQMASHIGVGGPQADTLTGGDGKDTLTGGGGADTLVGGGGNDSLDGGDGDDYLIGGAGADTLNGGNGQDIAGYGGAASAVRVELSNASANTGEAAGDTFSSVEGIVGSAHNDVLVGLSASASSIWGGEGNDVVTGGSQNDYLLGEAGNDTISGGDGNDHIVGGAGADLLVGGMGSDTVSYAGAAVGVNVYLGSNGRNTGDAAGDVLTSIENITGSAHDDVLVARQAPVGFFAEYFVQAGPISSMSQINWNALPTYVTVERDATWGTADRPGAVFPGGPADYVAARHSGSFDVTAGGVYTFYSASDDGSQIYIDGALIVNNDGVHDYNTSKQGSVTLAAGRHQIEVRYFENTGGTVQWIEWSGPGIAKQVMNDTVVRASAAGSGAIAGLLAEYFVLTPSTASLSLVPWDTPPSRVELWTALDKNFGSGAIYAGGPSDYVAIRLTGAVSVTSAGTYTFYGASDDGTEIYVDGVLVTSGGGPSPFSGSVTLSAGTHRIEVRYLEYTSPANLKIEWSGPSLARQVLGQAHANVDADDISSAPATLDGGAGNDLLTGGIGGDYLFGGSGTDTLNGGDGDDVLVGGAGADILSGGAGYDVASYGDALSGVTVNLGNMLANTGDAVGDTYSSIDAVSGSLHGDTLIAASAVAVLFGQAGNDVIIGGSAADYLDGSDGNDQLNGGAGTDTLEGGSGDDQLSGGADFDTIKGGAGNDWLDGGIGADSLDGGDGHDVVSYQTSAARVTLDLADASKNSGEAQLDTLTNIEGARGTSFDDVLGGNGISNTFYGEVGADRLWGHGGDDFLYGGSGNDELYGGFGADLLDGGLGSDVAQYRDALIAVIADLSGIMANSGEATGDTYVSIEDLGGSAFDDLLGGDAGANVLWGYAGNDTLLGRGGNDILRGGDGTDNLLGGEGADTLYGEGGWNAACYWEATSGVTADLVTPSNNTGEAAGDVYVSIHGLSGSAFGDTLRGNSAANTIWGGRKRYPRRS